MTSEEINRVQVSSFVLLHNILHLKSKQNIYLWLFFACLFGLFGFFNPIKFEMPDLKGPSKPSGRHRNHLRSCLNVDERSH